MTMLAWNHRQERRRRWSNRAQTVLLLGGMAALLALCGWIIAGTTGVIWGLIGGATGMLLGPSVPPALVLRLYRARALAPWQFPPLHQLLAGLAQRAGLERPPTLHIMAGAGLNAFAVGGRADAAIAISEDLLYQLDQRELAGVLAHEISHIAHGDIRILSLADLIGRLTRMMAWLGALLLVLGLPMVMSGADGFPLPLVLLLLVSPSLAALLQLALSRTREFDADLAAAHLTGDPLGLVSALEKMESPGLKLWERLALRRRPADPPSLLRSHPSTQERIERLLALPVPRPR